MILNQILNKIYFTMLNQQNNYKKKVHFTLEKQKMKIKNKYQFFNFKN